MKIMPVMALSVLALSCGAGASEGALPEVHKSVAQICAEAKQDVAQANQQYTGGCSNRQWCCESL
ncbi:transcriptional regulator [Zymobacter palmae]|uniref:Transcriptional regulator n=1 Tax=Zymobacter palmae TaxID=33074 RepID=A0A348HE76_9GAMM|nr:hypothetical protein [Zymobacter palmae]BBG29928.1 transcriptional regulator [Zymobacter palmae]